MLVHLYFEIAVELAYFHARTGESITNRRVEIPCVADTFYRCNGGGQVAPFVRQYGRVSADLRLSRRRVTVAAQLIVKAPCAHLLAEKKKLRCLARVCALRQHTVERRDIGHRLAPFAGFVANADQRSATLSKKTVPGQLFAGPDAFELDIGIVQEWRAAR